MLLMHWPDNFYHSSEDTPDKVDPSELKRAGLIAFGAARYIAGAGGEEVERLAARVAAGGRMRLAQDISRALTTAADAVTSTLARMRLQTMLEREARAIASSAGLDMSRRAAVEALAAEFRKEETTFLSLALRSLPPAAPEPALAEGGRVPNRTGRYLSSMWHNNLADRLSSEEAARAFRIVNELPHGDFSAFELFNLIDGQRTLVEIANILDSESTSEHMFNEYFGDGSMAPPHPYSGPRVDREKLVELLAFARKAGLVTW